MNLLFDISVFASLFYVPGKQYALLRVPEALAAELVRREGVDVTFSGVEAPVESWLGLQSHPLWGAAPFAHGRPGGLAASAARWVKRSRARNPIAPPLAGKLARKAFKWWEGARYVRCGGGFSRALRRAEVFHRELGECRAGLGGKSTPEVYTIYDLIPLRHPEWAHAAPWLEHSLRSSRDTGAHYLCISEHVKNDLCDYLGLAPGRASTFPLAASAEVFHSCGDARAVAEAGKRYAVPDAPYFLTVSTVNARKNCAHVVRAFYRFIEETGDSDLHLVMAGQLWGEAGEVFDALGSNPRLRGRIVVTGYVEDRDLAPLMSGALGFVFMSRAEGFGLPPLEAMQCGTPVIASNATSLPEVVGEAGILLAPDDEDGLCEAMLELRDSEDRRRELSRKGIERAKLFSWEKSAARVVEAYRRAIGPRKSS